MTNLSLPLYFFCTMYCVICAPPSDAGGSQTKSTLFSS